MMQDVVTALGNEAELIHNPRPQLPHRRVSSAGAGRADRGAAARRCSAIARHRHADAESVTDVTNAEPAMTAGVARTRRYRASYNAESSPRAMRPSRGSGTVPITTT